jgi:hypothetical protein
MTPISKILLLMSPLIFFIEIFIYSFFTYLINLKSDVTVLLAIVLANLIIIIHYFIIKKLISKHNQQKQNLKH